MFDGKQCLTYRERENPHGKGGGDYKCEKHHGCLDDAGHHKGEIARVNISTGGRWDKSQ